LKYKRIAVIGELRYSAEREQQVSDP
jgi:hypothetical protein